MCTLDYTRTYLCPHWLLLEHTHVLISGMFRLKRQSHCPPKSFAILTSLHPRWRTPAPTISFLENTPRLRQPTLLLKTVPKGVPPFWLSTSPLQGNTHYDVIVLLLHISPLALGGPKWFIFSGNSVLWSVHSNQTGGGGYTLQIIY